MSGKVKFYYGLTGGEGNTLFESLKDSHFQDLIDGQAELYTEGAKPGGDWRESFIDEKLWGMLDGDDLDKISAVAGADWLSNKEIKEWLVKNKCPEGVVETEEDLINDWAWARAGFDGETGVLWDCDHDDDVETALSFGLIKYPYTINGRYVDGGGHRIPAKTANKIKDLIDRTSSCNNKEIEEHLREQASKLERDFVESAIRVSGFNCDIHGGSAKYIKPIPRSEVITCPSCGHPVCPVCANAYNDDPMTVEKARAYLKSCDEVSGMAYCGQCGDWGEGFMLRFLKLVGCPIPPEYTNTKSRPRIASFYATARVDALEDSREIVSCVKKEFDKGVSGIIKVNHPTGEIWGYPERHPEGWVVTVLYPEER